MSVRWEGATAQCVRLDCICLPCSILHTQLAESIGADITKYDFIHWSLRTYIHTNNEAVVMPLLPPDLCSQHYCWPEQAYPRSFVLADPYVLLRGLFP